MSNTMILVDNFDGTSLSDISQTKSDDSQKLQRHIFITSIDNITYDIAGNNAHNKVISPYSLATPATGCIITSIDNITYDIAGNIFL